MGLRQGTLESLVSGLQFESDWRDRSVFLTGHTGFKGGWLALWLKQLGASIHGYALDPPTTPNLFSAARINHVLASDTRADLADRKALFDALEKSQPQVVFHLAAQPLVRESYRTPIDTFATNVMGTAHVLEAARSVPSIRAVVVVTTDKVYENKESAVAYREHDPLGGHDPYSASKAAAEIVTASYRDSFFSADAQARHPASIASARAGNVIGGGDWAADRLVPDCLRAFDKGAPVELRFPNAVRPWQHVLEPLAGYLLLAEQLIANGDRFARAWNFGPDIRDNATVGSVANQIAKIWGDARVITAPSTNNPHEAGLLSLASELAQSSLEWHSRWPLNEALSRTVAWHRAWLKQEDMEAVSCEQIRDYMNSSVRS